MCFGFTDPTQKASSSSSSSCSSMEEMKLMVEGGEKSDSVVVSKRRRTACKAAGNVVDSKNKIDMSCMYGCWALWCHEQKSFDSSVVAFGA